MCRTVGFPFLIDYPPLSIVQRGGTSRGLPRSSRTPFSSVFAWNQLDTLSCHSRFPLPGMTAVRVGGTKGTGTVYLLRPFLWAQSLILLQYPLVCYLLDLFNQWLLFSLRFSPRPPMHPKRGFPTSSDRASCPFTSSVALFSPLPRFFDLVTGEVSYGLGLPIVVHRSGTPRSNESVRQFPVPLTPPPFPGDRTSFIPSRIRPGVRGRLLQLPTAYLPRDIFHYCRRPFCVSHFGCSQGDGVDFT